MKGQGLVEYAVILVLCVVVVVVVLMMIGPSIGNVFSKMAYGVNANSTCNNSSFECRETQLKKCLKTEQYTRQECIDLVGHG